jgi:hypothetical protein
MSDRSVIYKNRIYVEPFRCFCCGKQIGRGQFAFSTLCPTCDTGSCQYTIRDGGQVRFSHPVFDPTTIPSEPLTNDEVEIIMRRMGYSLETSLRLKI